MVSGFVMIQPSADDLQTDRPAAAPRRRAPRRPLLRVRGLVRTRPKRPRRFHPWIIRDLFRDNELIDGAIESTADGESTLANITMPLYLLAGATDDITHPTRYRDRRPRFDPARARAPPRHDWRSPRPVHGPRSAARALATDPDRHAPALAATENPEDSDPIRPPDQRADQCPREVERKPDREADLPPAGGRALADDLLLDWRGVATGHAQPRGSRVAAATTLLAQTDRVANLRQSDSARGRRPSCWLRLSPAVTSSRRPRAPLS